MGCHHACGTKCGQPQILAASCSPAGYRQILRKKYDYPKKGAGEFTLPGLFKVSAVPVPATKKRFGKNPFTGQEQWFATKPASVK